MSAASEPRRLAEEAVRKLFVNGGGQSADRLVLTVDGPPKRDLGGWCFGAAVDAVEAVLRGGKAK